MSDKLEKLKEHFKENKKVYIGTSCGAIAGAASVALLWIAKGGITIQIVDSYKGINWKSPHFSINQIMLPALGDPGDVVKVVSTTPELAKKGILEGMMFASKSATANNLGVSRAELLQHLSGKNPDVRGATLEVIGKAGQPIPTQNT